MLVWLTPPDRGRCTWRIEIMPDGRVWVWQTAYGWVSSAPLRFPRDIGELGEWMVQRGIEPDDLIPG